MKVVLRTTIDGVGFAGEIHDVSEGYARNFLFPKKRAQPATAELLAKIARESDQQKKHKIEQRVSMSLLAQKLRDARVSFSVRTSDTGTLYAAITIPDIIREVKSQLGVDIKPSHFVGYTAIKHSGQQRVQLRIEGSLVTITIIVKHNEGNA